MAILKNFITQQKILIFRHHVFGRGRSCDTLLGGVDISNLHASLRWNEVAWELSDHSRNGTLFNGKPIVTGSTALLKVGNEIQFGEAQSSIWIVDNISPPTTLLWPADNSSDPIFLKHENNFLKENINEIKIKFTSEGKWSLTSCQGVCEIEDGDDIWIEGRQWFFVNQQKSLLTLDNSNKRKRNACRILLRFNISLDEEHVNLTIEMPKINIDLGERVHHYALLTLARLRHQDRASDYLDDTSSHGWIELEQLAKMLGIDSAHVNIHFFRLRKQLELTMHDEKVLPNLIEKRRGAIRFGDIAFEIIKGSRIECGTFLKMKRERDNQYENIV